MRAAKFLFGGVWFPLLWFPLRTSANGAPPNKSSAEHEGIKGFLVILLVLERFNEFISFLNRPFGLALAFWKAAEAIGIPPASCYDQHRERMIST